MATRTLMTVEEYLPIAERDPRPTELVDGEFVVNPHPRAGHGRLQALLAGALARWEEEVPGRAEVRGPTEVLLTEHDLYGPDLVITESQPNLTEREMLADLPLICVEVRSPSTWHRDLGRKKTVYEERGLPELWLVDGVAKEILVFRRSSPEAKSFDVTAELTVEDTLGSPLLPGFALPLSELFR